METLIEIPAALEANVFGKLDEHLKKIERASSLSFRECFKKFSLFL